MKPSLGGEVGCFASRSLRPVVEPQLASAARAGQQCRHHLAYESIRDGTAKTAQGRDTLFKIFQRIARTVCLLKRQASVEKFNCGALHCGHHGLRIFGAIHEMLDCRGVELQSPLMVAGGSPGTREVACAPRDTKPVARLLIERQNTLERRDGAVGKLGLPIDHRELFKHTDLVAFVEASRPDQRQRVLATIMCVVQDSKFGEALAPTLKNTKLPDAVRLQRGYLLKQLEQK